MNPLIELHHQAGAETQNYGEIEIVSTFGEMPPEYAAIRKRSGLMDLPHRGLIELTGKDRLTFLNNLISNQIFDKQTKTGLSAGQGVYAFLLNAKTGRIIDRSQRHRARRSNVSRAGATVMSQSVAEALEKYRFAEQVKIESRIDVLHEIALHGPENDLPELTAMASAEIELFGVKTDCLAR